MMKGLAIQQNPVVLENTSNLTSASGEASVSSGSRAENENMYQQSLEYSTDPLPPKKKRNLPGNPDPEAEVIALSPKTLMATNRFVCEICSKGFQRDQNLQLHRRGHNLPWKLKQRTNKEVRKRVYICPEPSCVHHEASRALGDLTGIKKHFCRKHGEKKWKCDKCSKRYAVQSDWKAHSKVCGTREYRCDCGTLFSRRDSFITHRAFCDALAEESSRSAMTTKPPTYPLLLSQANSSSSTHMINLQSPFPDILGASQNNSSSSSSSIFNTQKEQQQHFNLKSDIPPWLSCTPVVSTAGPGSPMQAPTSVNHLDLSSSIFSTRLAHEFSQSQAQVSHENVHLPPPFHAPANSPHMSATALLQKAAKMGATMSKPGFALNLSSSREAMESGFVQGLTAFGNKAAGLMQQTTAAPSLLHSMMGSSLSSAAGLEGSFGEAFGGILGDPNREGNHLLENLSTTHKKNEEGGGNDGLSTRDFLGLRAFSHKDMIFNIAAGLDNPCMDSSSYGQIHDQKPWQG